MSGPEDGLSPGEQRVRDLLHQLAGAPPQPGTALARRVVQKARWQRTVRGAVVAATQVVGALADGLRMLVGGRR